MTDQEIIDGNKLIALFMGYKEDEIQAEEWCGCNVLDEVFLGHKEMCPANYHDNWSRLMPVVEKLESMKFFVVIGFNNYCGIADAREKRVAGKWESSHTVSEETATYTWKPDTKIEAVYIAVIKFITWYNQQPK